MRPFLWMYWMHTISRSANDMSIIKRLCSRIGNDEDPIAEGAYDVLCLVLTLWMAAGVLWLVFEVLTSMGGV